MATPETPLENYNKREPFEVVHRSKTVRVFMYNARTQAIQIVEPHHVLSVSTSKSIGGYGSFEISFMVQDDSERVYDHRFKEVASVSTKVEDRGSAWFADIRPMSLVHIFMGDAEDIDKVINLRYKETKYTVTPDTTPSSKKEPPPFDTASLFGNTVDEDLKASQKEGLIKQDRVLGEKYLKYSLMLGMVESVSHSLERSDAGFRKIVTVRGHDLMKPFYTDTLLLAGPIINNKNSSETGVIPVYGVARDQSEDALMSKTIDSLFDQLTSGISGDIDNVKDNKNTDDNSAWGWRVKLLTQGNGAGLSVSVRDYVKQLLSTAPIIRFLFGPRSAELDKVDPKSLPSGFQSADLYKVLSEKGIGRFYELDPCIGRFENERLTMLSALSFQGSLYDLITKSLPSPIIEFFGDTVGDKMQLVIRRPPFWRSQLMSGYKTLMEDGYKNIGFSSKQLPGLDTLNNTQRAPLINPYTGDLADDDNRPDYRSMQSDDYMVYEPNRLDLLSEEQGYEIEADRYHVIKHSQMIGINYGTSDNRIATAYQTFPTSPFLQAQAPSPILYPMLVDVPATRVFGMRSMQIASPWMDAKNEMISITTTSGKVDIKIQDTPVKDIIPTKTKTERVAGRWLALTIGSGSEKKYVIRFDGTTKNPISAKTNDQLDLIVVKVEGRPERLQNYVQSLALTSSNTAREVYQTSDQFCPIKKIDDFSYEVLDLTSEAKAKFDAITTTLPVSITLGYLNSTSEELRQKYQQSRAVSWVVFAYRETVLQYLMNRDLSAMKSGTLTIMGRPEIRIGDKIYIENKDLLAYVEGVNNIFEFGNTVYTVVNFTRGQPLFPPEKGRLVNYDHGHKVVIYKKGGSTISPAPKPITKRLPSRSPAPKKTAVRTKPSRTGKP